MTASFPPTLALTVTLRAVELQRLPPFLGSALHGALARALYRTVCVFPQRAQCAGCPLLARCAYPALIETPAGANECLRAAGIRDQAPRPLVLAPEPGWTRASGHPFRVAAEARVPFRLTLIGRATADLPVVTVALQALAKRGLGIPEPDGHHQSAAQPNRRRASMALDGVVTADESHVVFDPSSDTFTLPPLPSVIVEEPADAVVIELVSPLRLKHSGQLASEVTPAMFFIALARRANAMAILHGAGSPAIDEAAVVAAAGRLAADGCRLRRVHVTRYSARQRTRMQWPGLMGTLCWRGEALRELWPLLRFGESVQVGKGAALGFGRYRLIPAS